MPERMPNSRSVLLLAATLACACSSPHESGAEPAAPAATQAHVPPRPKLARGPRLAIQAGQGVGAIRLGANVGTIERLMGEPCQIKTETLCRYIDRGVDFHLVNAETEWIHVQRQERPAGRGFDGEELRFGSFNGAIPPDVMLGMVPREIQKYLGAPQRVEYVPQPNPTTVIERHYYPGLVAEYDLYTKRNFGPNPSSERVVILGGVRVVKRTE
jgi:hypothetical protein